MNAEIGALIEQIRAFTNARDWSQFHSPKNLVSALCVESAELLEKFQWLTEEQSRSLIDDQKSEVAMEVADVFIYLLQICDSLKIDPIVAVERKLVLNEQKHPVERARGSNKKYTDL